MSGLSPERITQDRVIKLFHGELGYRYLGDWKDRAGNSNIEEELLAGYLQRRGYSSAEVSGALFQLRAAADISQVGLYEANRRVYSLLRYGVQVKAAADQPTSTVTLIDWHNTEANDFAIAEEVTLKGPLERRPDLVLYVNGIAIAVIELKSSRVGIGDGIRQNLSNQQPEFNAWFFATNQLVLAGNDSEGLRYGAILTPEKYFLTWKEDEDDNSRLKIDKYLAKICSKDRLIELIRDFVLFDAGIKKLPRVHQYVGIKAAQQQVVDRRGGIIWHTQGSGKSIVMVLLARWILATNPNARVVVITDRDELDKQIEGVFGGAGETIQRTSSGRDLMQALGQPLPRLLCSLVHKFGVRGVDDFEAFLEQLEAEPSPAVGELFIFVDECHRTQSGKLHRVMKALLPEAVFIGFTGTPLLKKDKATSLEIFGGYIHTYKFSEGVEDQVVLDLVYEARDIDQRLSSQARVDQWFDTKTASLNPWQQRELKRQWGTLQSVLSSKARMNRIVADILFDFSVQPRLASQRGNAIFVASSIYEACRYFELFNQTELKGKCAVITSYDPKASDVSKEEVGANTETDKQFIFNTYTNLLEGLAPQPGMTRTETYEEQAKHHFIHQPVQMKLLIVVDKLLTGFDAPSCSVLYIDKSMQDHGLFQAICRTNRLDGDDKPYGCIVDYKDLFKKVENAIAVYSSDDLDHSAGGVDPNVILQDRLTKAKERLEEALEQEALLAEPVAPPMEELEILHHFCGNTEFAADLQEREPLRMAYYKAVAELTRAYAALANELPDAGYSLSEANRITRQRDKALDWRQVIRLGAGENLDLKAYESDMRYLIDSYIEADLPRKISAFDDIGLLELIVKTGAAEAIQKQFGKGATNRTAVAETIENNVRRTIISERANDPAFYDRMSELLDEIIRFRKQQADAYEEYLRRVAELARQLNQQTADNTPTELDTAGKRALWNNLNGNLKLALLIDSTVRQVRPDGWRGVQAKEQQIKAALFGVLQDAAEVERLFPILVAQPEY
ncbi:HsdR family type I site-specific deoxyribonuclease [Cyanobium sp. HWJ4-Hawea]|uniref:type I restriction endonuclease subunit R n=1 Tax=Cyanobium sp. HWJ4-Hawea TaxID=2823713 RepID=UPI0020CC7842|nr:HsdR family type I site-specific deoxyribonuclease [Cyanobium sp. HWJ4-Hawea]MCP9808842.1 HsdR family type I site-specific deoxyribonuclease [Cyanobium sp. HWJ4-Hawea]